MGVLSWGGLEAGGWLSKTGGGERGVGGLCCGTWGLAPFETSAISGERWEQRATQQATGVSGLGR